jgi:thioredoxin reductase/Fe-S-cluster-containing hydrogenase component 2
MIEREVIVVGAGPAGLSAAIEAARAGADTLLIDENDKAGGQLFKQIHKFFGSKAHHAGVRGIDIGRQLLADADGAGVQTWLDTVVWGLFEDRKVSVLRNRRSLDIKAKSIVLATGAMENGLSFPGWTLPGVITAGAAQTMINVHRILPGRRVVMIGAGNVGVIVAYQLMQAGADVVAVVEALPRIGGYGVHAAKIRRAGVPILTSHTILEAQGTNQVEAAVIARMDSDLRTIPGSERTLDVDTICLAVGLTPMAELAQMAGCRLAHLAGLGGHVPLHSKRMETTIPGIYVVGDISGIEEANTAMEEGRLAGTAIAADLGYLSMNEAEQRLAQIWERIGELRLGNFGELRAKAKATQMTISGSDVTRFERESHWSAGATVRQEPLVAGVAYTGVHCEEELKSSPGFPDPERLRKGGVAVIECVQDIPCNPCELACHQGAIRIGVPITNLPALDVDACSGCGLCVAACPGLAIFVVDLNYSHTEALVTLPYEYTSLPDIGDLVGAVDREGTIVTAARVTRVHNARAFNHTAVITIAVPKEYGMVVRGISRTRVS